jgi:SAM-dependent methyltransferase
VRGDAEQLPFGDAAFDAAVANFAILHVARPERVAAALARVLRPGGRAALTVWDVPERSRLIGVFMDAVAETGAAAPDSVPAGPDFFRFADEDELVGLLIGAGLVDVEVETIEFRHSLGGADELWSGMLGGTVRVRAMLDGQDEDARRRIRAAFDRLVGEHAGDAGIELPVSVKLASGRKPP